MLYGYAYSRVRESTIINAKESPSLKRLKSSSKNLFHVWSQYEAEYMKYQYFLIWFINWFVDIIFMLSQASSIHNKDSGCQTSNIVLSIH